MRQEVIKMSDWNSDFLKFEDDDEDEGGLHTGDEEDTWV